MRRLCPAVVVVLGILAWPVGLCAQAGAAPPAPRTFTVEDALDYAVDHYPAVRAALEDVTTANANVSVAACAYLPRLDALWQTTRATANNVFGQILPQSVIPSLSGPVLPSASTESAWGSAAGASLSWEPFDFGLRGSSVREAEAGLARARADAALTRLEVQGAVVAAFLSVVAAEQAVAAAQADMERRQALAGVAHALATNQLRPGADASRADAELAAARTRVIQARQAVVLAGATFSRVLGIRGDVTVNATGLVDEVPRSASVGAVAPDHPVTQSRRAMVDVARMHEDVLAKTDRPRVYLQSSLFARGSGAQVDGGFEGGASGLWPGRANWAAGVQVVLPNLFDFASLRARRAASAASTRAEIARYDEAVLAVTSQASTADALADAARAVALNTPVQLAAAEQSEAQARARYDAGLASIVEVTDAQALLVQAEYQNAAARIDVWRALLAQAISRGSVQPFIDLVHASRAP